MVKLGNKELIAGIAAVVAIFFLTLFGLTGLKTLAGAFLFFFLPFYLILDNFDLEKSEKIIFSLFIGLGVFSTFVYYLGFLFGSIKMAAAVTFFLLASIGIGLRFFVKKRKKEQTLQS